MTRALKARPRLARLAVPLLLGVLVGCASDREMAEEHRKLSLRLEHVPITRSPAGEDVELHALVQSSLKGPRMEAWVRVLDGEEEEKIALEISEEGQATATLPGRERGEVIRYVIEARDAAGLVVSLPRKADTGRAYTLTFEGKSSRILGAISFLSVLIAFLAYLGAGAASIQNLRAQMSTGPAGLLGGFAVGVVVVGLFLLGAIHAQQVTGRPWPSSPVLFSLSRGDLGIVTLIWIVNLFLGRRVLLDQEPEASRGERGFSFTGIVAAALLLLFAFF